MRVLRWFDPADEGCLTRLAAAGLIALVLAACAGAATLALVLRSERAQYAVLYGFIESGENRLALTVAERMVSVYPTSDWHYYRQKAVALRRLGRIDESLRVYDDAIQAFPDLWWPHSHRCFYTALLTGDTETALPHCDRALALDPDEPAIAYDRRAFVRAMAGDLDGARDDLAEALDRFEAGDDYAIERRATRERWLEALEAGRDPLGEAEIQAERERY